MTEVDIKHFLVIYDVPAGMAQVTPFGTDYDAAIEAYGDAEHAAQEHDDNVDIVLLSADSLDTVKRTHSSYFETKTFERFLPPGVLTSTS